MSNPFPEDEHPLALFEAANKSLPLPLTSAKLKQHHRQQAPHLLPIKSLPASPKLKTMSNITGANANGTLRTPLKSKENNALMLNNVASPVIGSRYNKQHKVSTPVLKHITANTTPLPTRPATIHFTTNPVVTTSTTIINQSKQQHPNPPLSSSTGTSSKSIPSSSAASTPSSIAQPQMIEWIKKVERERWSMEEQKWSSRVKCLESTVEQLKKDMAARYQEYYEQVCAERANHQQTSQRVTTLQGDVARYEKLVAELTQFTVSKSEHEELIKKHDDMVKQNHEQDVFMEEVRVELEHLRPLAQQHDDHQAELAILRQERDSAVKRVQALSEALDETLNDNERLYLQVKESLEQKVAPSSPQARRTSTSCQTDPIPTSVPVNIAPLPPVMKISPLKIMVDSHTQTQSPSTKDCEVQTDEMEVPPPPAVQRPPTAEIATTTDDLPQPDAEPTAIAFSKETADANIQTDGLLSHQDLPIVKEAQIAIREFKMMKYANALMAEQMTQHQGKYNTEIKDLKKQVRTLNDMEHQIKTYEADMAAAAKLVQEQSARVEVLEEEVVTLRNDKAMLMTTIEEFEKYV